LQNKWPFGRETECGLNKVTSQKETNQMSTAPALTTLVSLFHTQERATKALSDLHTAGVPQQSIQTVGGLSQTVVPEQALASLKALNLPAKDLQILSDGLKSGGTLIIVRVDHSLADKAESVFEDYHAHEIDARTVQTAPQAAVARTAMDTNAVIPVVEEELVVGKRKVERGGVRVFSRMIETPVEEQVTLREEHTTFERHAVNRPISEAELNNLQNRSVEVHEMAEEAVVGKTARVVEEVHIGKESTERTEQIKDSVRKTQVEVDQVPVTETKTATRSSKL
jgi:uncharacterized protein (TIGR02271 family)